MPGSRNDTEALDLFLIRAGELFDRRVVKSGDLKSTLSLNASIGEAVSIQSHLPDEEDFRSFLLVFRHFVAAKEPIYIPNMHNTLYRAIESDVIKEKLAEWRQGYKFSLKGSGFNLKIDDLPDTPEGLLNMWINGRYFHNDSRMRRGLERLDPTGMTLVRASVLGLIVETCRYVKFIGTIIIVCRRDGILHV